MPKRRIDRETGEPALTQKEKRMVDGYVANGGNATRAAVDAGYSPKRASQAAWNVLNRPSVQERIRTRIAQAQIDPDEVIGSLASQMRADVTDCFGPDGAFSVDLARQNGLGHLLKVSTTIHRKPDQDGCLRMVGDATKIEFLSPQAAAVQLARINAISDPGSTETAQSRQSILDERLAMLERLIARTMEEFPGKSREQVFQAILDVKPEAAKLLAMLPQPEPNSNKGGS